MDTVDLSNTDLGFGKVVGNAGETDSFKHSIDELFLKVDELEQRVNNVNQFYSSNNVDEAMKTPSNTSMKNKERPAPSYKKLQLDASRREAAAAKRMHDLMRQFGSILRQITQHKFAWPFMHPVDVEGLGLDDYYEVIDRPMDFSTIKNQMEANDGTGYRHVRDICADVRLIFDNAMKYNEEKSNVYKMANTLLAKFEERWLQLLPKVMEEEKRREDEEAEAQSSLLLVQEAAQAKVARDLSNELDGVDSHLEELKGVVISKCRKLSIEDKRNIGIALSKLDAEELSKALEIVAQANPNFQPTEENLDLDIDEQSDFTLWRLKFFVKDVLEARGKCASKSGNSNSDAEDQRGPASPKNKVVSKRKRDASDSAAKPAKNRNKKPMSKTVKLL